MRFLVVVFCLLLVFPVAAVEVVRQDVQQGGFMLLQVEDGEVVRWQGEVLPVSAGGFALVGFDRKQPRNNVLEVCVEAVCEQRKIVVQPRTYKVQRVTRIPQKTVTPDKAQLARVAADNQATAAARALARKPEARRQDWFAANFVRPSVGPTTGVFGSARTYNGQERSWHKGHDFAAPTGTPVVAPTDGVVRLARDTFMSGNLVMLDHGGELTSVYAHLDRMQVKVGQRVRAGEQLGTVGTTGRSSGPHLHWGLYWRNVAIDPILWLGQDSTMDAPRTPPSRKTTP
ncbi:MAG: M23 family metallopeptidase [Proteobacteria bacterium]|nr:M23 family metallopeptidase [Pseudomonadota bacterium]NBX85647.1 M23 family metallopeptidase [Pseudomonadota bacterium]